MKNLSWFLSVLSLVMLLACGGSDDSNPTNENPGNFMVTVVEVGTTSVTISWTASTDPDGDDVTYQVAIEGQNVGNPTTTAIDEFNITGFTSGTTYSGTVTAEDGRGGSNVQSFTFTTNSENGNSAPGAFTVTVGSDLTNSTAEISWTAAVDPDGDNVTYEVELNSASVQAGITMTDYDFTDLSGGINYSGKVIASDGNGGVTESSFSFQTYVIDISMFLEGVGDCTGGNNCLKSITLVDCNYKEGGSGKCYEITYYSNPIDDNGPFCPETVNDTGGIGNYDGDGIANGGTQNGDAVGLTRLDGAFFQKMENDGYDIIDENGDINIDTLVPGGGRLSQQSAACLEPIADDDLELVFQIPVYPESLSSADDIESVEYIGLALDGIPINGEPPSVVANNGKIPSLDRCGVHHDPSGYLHWHFVGQNMNEVLQAEGLYEAGVFECEKITQDPDALIGFARDGYPIYSSEDTDANPPALDNCNGHTHATTEYPEGVYHYHASTDVPNVPPCIVGKQASNAFAKP